MSTITVDSIRGNHFSIKEILGRRALDMTVPNPNIGTIVGINIFSNNFIIANEDVTGNIVLSNSKKIILLAT